MTSKPALSIVVVAFDMARELPRTIQSLSPGYQRGIDAADYELIVVDNGSNDPVPLEVLAQWGADVREVKPARRSSSPAAAINSGIEAASAPFVGVMIDGARMATPGLLRGVLEARGVHPRPLVGTLGFHLGPDVQMRTCAAGYDARVEDRLLAEIGWPDEGYRLFEIAALAGSSAGGWFLPMAESNALFLNREMWEQLDGFDERFESPGGGLVNLDTWRRACELTDVQPVIVLGEGTFHQVHGGVATNSPVSRSAAYRAEYQKIRGTDFSRPDMEPIYVGRAPGPSVPWIERSAQIAASRVAPE